MVFVLNPVNSQLFGLDTLSHEIRTPVNGILGVFLILSDFLLSPGDTWDLLSFLRNSPLILHMLLQGCLQKLLGIMLAIVMHPFHIGDHCIIDKEQLVIEKIGLISTVFLKDNNRKVECLNSVLLTKFISNLNRSSELADSFDILVSSTTCLDTTAALKLKIEEYKISNLYQTLEHMLLGSMAVPFDIRYILDDVLSLSSEKSRHKGIERCPSLNYDLGYVRDCFEMLELQTARYGSYVGIHCASLREKRWFVELLVGLDNELLRRNKLIARAPIAEVNSIVDISKGCG
ncbi:hypothetical protein POM88_012274 [Heracleum sosnowskyi]|uniref:Mechanosensitive ion channel MscS domain-containing protein n=1 Tax=Heracleum sosnowskyi TaxID=360622 RepID=A0AAD8IXR3_9APIA|nr:hypothetical protein POM88_012274 [Heracleum sosnowskyi]